MDGHSEPRNWASDLSRELFHLNGDPERLRRNIDEYFAPDFVREDRRRLVGFPTADRDTFVEQLVTWQQVTDTPGTFSVQEIVAVRGERCVLLRARVSYGETWTEFLSIGQLDPLGRTTRSVVFDPDDTEAALAELDRLHAEIESDDG